MEKNIFRQKYPFGYQNNKLTIREQTSHEQLRDKKYNFVQILRDENRLAIIGLRLGSIQKKINVIEKELERIKIETHKYGGDDNDKNYDIFIKLVERRDNLKECANKLELKYMNK